MGPDLLAAADAARLLEEGGVLLLGTDTLPGLHARVDRPAAVARVTALKGRAGGKPLLVLVASPAAAAAVADLDDPRRRAFAERCWPGPFSLVLPARPGVDAAVTGGGPGVAVRVPRPPGLRALLVRIGAPVVSTSANRSGEPPAVDLEAAAAAFGTAVDGVAAPLDPPPATSAPSALVDVLTWPPRVLRAGPEPVPDAGDLDRPAGAT